MKATGLIAIFASAMTFTIMTAPLALAEGDAASGEKVFNRCKTCHILEGDQKRLGPSLECVFGRKAGAVAGYTYSDAMASSGITWDEDNLKAYISDPKAFIPGNKMAFPGLKNPQQLEDLLEYLEESPAKNCSK